MCDQSIADTPEPGHAHVERQRLAVLRQPGPVETVSRLFAVRGHQAHRLRVVTMRQRNPGVGGASIRGCDAGHHFEMDTGLVQRFQFLTAATEHERIATLEPHHARAAAGMVDQQAMDPGLIDARSLRLFADIDHLRIAARHRQDFGADQMVVQDHVGFVQGAQCAQGQQAGIAGAGTDQQHGALRVDAIDRGQRVVQRDLGGSALACAQQSWHDTGEYALEPAAALRQITQARADRVAVALEQFDQITERLLEQQFDARAHMPRHHRCSTTRRHRNLQTPTLDHGRELHRGARDIVDHVGEHPACRCGFGDAGIAGLVTGRGDHQPGIVDQRSLEFAEPQGDAALFRERSDFRIRGMGHHADLRAGIEQRTNLARRDAARPDHQHAASAQVRKQRKQAVRSGADGGLAHGRKLGQSIPGAEMARSTAHIPGRYVRIDRRSCQELARRAAFRHEHHEHFASQPAEGLRGRASLATRLRDQQ